MHELKFQLVRNSLQTFYFSFIRPRLEYADIDADVNSSIRLFADDTSFYIIVDDPIQAAEQLKLDLAKR